VGSAHGEDRSKAVLERELSGQITALLINWSAGDAASLEALMPLVYEELRRMARLYLRRERPGHTLVTTGLVHEAYFRLADQRRTSWKCRSHFFGIASQAMRRILVDHARAKQAARRGSGVEPVSFQEAEEMPRPDDRNLVLVDEALRHLEATDPRAGKVVELRFFGGLTNEEAADVLGISAVTVQRQWAAAKAWLFHEMTGRHPR
jgi:RNA polymerase sigma factor (TIGR02999 family)